MVFLIKDGISKKMVFLIKDGISLSSFPHVDTC